MIRMILPIGALLFLVACGDDSASANYQSEDVRSSSSQKSSSSSSRHSKPNPESSSSKTVSSSSKPVSSSSKISSSSSKIASSSSNSRNDEKSSSSSRNNEKSSSSIHNDKKSSSSSLNDEKSSSSSFNDVSSSSQDVFLSSSEGSSSSSSSSEILTDPSKIFDIRKPQADVYSCEVPWGGETMTESFPQHDVICTYDYNGEQGFLYVQLTPTSCGGGMSITPGRYDVDKAELYVNGKFGDVSNIEYEWGGNHHVEYLQFTYKGNVFRYSQSTMGWGGRPCQSMDCLKVFESDGKTYVENGCNERSLPIVCRTVNEKGKVADFTDNYKVCEGDPRTLGYEVEY